MKKVIIILGFFLLTGCSTSNHLASNFGECNYDKDCDIVATHYHVY